MKPIKPPKTLEVLEQDVDGLYTVSSAFSKRFQDLEGRIANLQRRETWLILLLVLLLFLTALMNINRSFQPSSSSSRNATKTSSEYSKPTIPSE